MNTTSTHVNYTETNAFSKLVVDYLSGSETLRPFYKHTPDIEGILKAIDARKNAPVNRQLLVDQMRIQYAHLALAPKQEEFLQQLLLDNTFTITTAHQPNIFTGPLYFIYKILHAIKMADALRTQLEGFHFVPVYYMGSEDADLDELGHFFVDGEKRTWQTSQTGAVGRMNTTGFELLTNQLEGQFAHMPFGKQMVEMCRNAYQQHDNVQQATLYLVNELFKAFGLLVVIPDNAAFKKVFAPIVKKELLQHFSQPAVEKAIALLEPHYKIQVKGRPINLFYLNHDGQRERIEKVGDQYAVHALGLSFSENEICRLVDEQPQLFSANVILRGVFQECILPNIAFIGGGGELAYWLELKGVFEKAGVPFPVLVLRNSMLILNERHQHLQIKNDITDAELFLPVQQLLDKAAAEKHEIGLIISNEEKVLFEIYERWQLSAEKNDITLKPYVAALHTKALQGLHALDKKLKRAARKNLGDSGGQLVKLKSQIFPNENLQERVENFMPFFAAYGPALLQALYHHSQAFQTESFTIVKLPATNK
jgi:bacillithiol biosynthesis cysteine-adding enzyme BshC